MKLKINEINIGPRIRHNMGDLTPLKESIYKVGLLQPIIVNPKKELISGFRRLEACRQLGWNEIDVNMIETEGDVLKKLDIEYHENLGRMNLNSDEKQKYTKIRAKLLHPSKPINKIIFWLKALWNKIKSLFSKKNKTD